MGVDFSAPDGGPAFQIKESDSGWAVIRYEHDEEEIAITVWNDGDIVIAHGGMAMVIPPAVASKIIKLRDKIYKE
jgi:hypothetical protein